MDVDGGSQRSLTQHSADDDGPSWSLDGNWVFFRSRLASREGEMPGSCHRAKRPDASDLLEILVAVQQDPVRFQNELGD